MGNPSFHGFIIAETAAAVNSFFIFFQKKS